MEVVPQLCKTYKARKVLSVIRMCPLLCSTTFLCKNVFELISDILVKVTVALSNTEDIFIR